MPRYLSIKLEQNYLHLLNMKGTEKLQNDLTVLPMIHGVWKTSQFFVIQRERPGNSSQSHIDEVKREMVILWWKPENITRQKNRTTRNSGENEQEETSAWLQWFVT